MKRLPILLLFVLLVASCTHTTSWDTAFRQPSKDSRPWTFWYWMYGCVSDSGIRADLEAYARAGIAGVYLMPIRDAEADRDSLGGKATQLSDEWWRMMDVATQTADSLGLEIGIHFSDGFALGGGPWIAEEESMQRIVWSDTTIEGTGKEATFLLPEPKHYGKYYEDIMAFAFPAPDSLVPHPNVSFPFRSTTECDIDFTSEKPFTLRSLRIVTGGNNYQAHRWTLLTSEDGQDYEQVCYIRPARQGWQNTDAQATYSIPTTTSRYFRFHWTPDGSEPGCEDMDAAKWSPVLKVADLQLSSMPTIDSYEGKSGLVWRVSPDVDEGQIVYHKKLTRQADGTYVGKLDPGMKWCVRRVGHASTGHTNATGGGAKGLECDKFSTLSVEKQFDNWFGQIRHRVKHPQVITRLHIDSWECGSQNWSKNFAEEFKARRGYDIEDWLPVMTGVPTTDVRKCNKFLRDVRTNIAELVNDVFFATVRKKANAEHILISAECVAPTMVSDGLAHFRYADIPMGEFWLRSPTHDKPNDMLDAISAAHAYGKPIIQAEGFTELRGTWDETPAMLKPLLDRQYCLGINKIVYHVSAHNPWPSRKPGMTLDGIGTFFQPGNTWWPEMPAFSSYAMRCQSLLQRGEPVVDIAVYSGAEVPRRALLPEKIIESLPGLVGKEKFISEANRLKNKSIPIEVSPIGVKHTKNITRADTYTNALRGYKYDTVNPEVLNGLTVNSDGSMTTADGMTYSVLVIPQSHLMNMRAIGHHDPQIENLRSRGAHIITDVWTADDLSTIGIQRDIVLPEGCDYTHRHTATDDVYFISNQTEKTVSFIPQVRSSFPNIYLADPITGDISRLATNQSITLLPFGSTFVVYSSEKIEVPDFKPFRATHSTTLDGEWQMWFHDNEAFVATRGADHESWSHMSDPRLRYYSGHVTYKTRLSLTEVPTSARLVLLEVHDIATVFVNQKPCGTLWTKPYTADVGSALQNGDNDITIVVVNTWANALLGQSLGTPPFDGIWTNARYRLAEKEPLEAGLIGPVVLEYE